MSRRRRADKRNILADSRFNSIVVSKFINQLMLDGKKSVAEQIIYEALDIVAEKTKLEPDEALIKAIEKVQPEIEVRSRRVGGAAYPVPTEVRPERGRHLAIRWIIEAARKRAKVAMHKKLSDEIIDVLEEKGAAIKKRDEVYKVAEANRAFAHFRF
jgi:small subunit ribosomal protein S7